MSKNFIDPSVAVGGWRLKIDGLVDRPMELTYDQLNALPASEGYYTLMCISNEIGGDLWGNGIWRGVKLKYLLEQAGVHTDGVKAMFTGADDYRDSVTLDRALHPDALLAWEMNGQPLRTEHGFPARLLIPGIYGMKNVKWLTASPSSAATSAASGRARAGTMRRRIRPSRASTRRAIAMRSRRERSPWAGLPSRAIAGFSRSRSAPMRARRGRPRRSSQACRRIPGSCGEQMSRSTATREIRVRATDGLGHPQTREPAPPFPSGATGYDSITIAVTPHGRRGTASPSGRGRAKRG